ncbi:MAG: hypothetical protein SGPRY_005544 [Prymnesium sp.]
MPRRLTRALVACLLLQPSSVFAELSGCPCASDPSLFQFARSDDNSFAWIRPESDRSGTFANGQAFDFPLEYGSRCGSWDRGLPPFCNSIGSTPSFCNVEWCWVDPDTCRDSGVPFYLSQLLSPLQLHYSYATCSNLTYSSQARRAFEEFTETSTLGAFNNRVLRVAFPASYFPQHFKRNEMGEAVNTSNPMHYEYYTNTSIPWEGVYVDYLQAMTDQAKAMGVNLSFSFSQVSRYMLQRHSSAWTAAVHDVAIGLLDTSPGDFEPSAERLSLTPFTLAMRETHVWLLVPRPSSIPSDSSITFEKFSRCFAPFSTTLWLAILGVSLLVGILQSYVRYRLEGAEAPEDTVDGRGSHNYRRTAPLPRLGLLRLDCHIELQ